MRCSRFLFKCSLLRLISSNPLPQLTPSPDALTIATTNASIAPDPQPYSAIPSTTIPGFPNLELKILFRPSSPSNKPAILTLFDRFAAYARDKLEQGDPVVHQLPHSISSGQNYWMVWIRSPQADAHLFRWAELAAAAAVTYRAMSEKDCWMYTYGSVWWKPAGRPEARMMLLGGVVITDREPRAGEGEVLELGMPSGMMSDWDFPLYSVADKGVEQSEREQEPEQNVAVSKR